MRHLQSMGLIKANESWTTYDADDVVAGLQVRFEMQKTHCMQQITDPLRHQYAAVRSRAVLTSVCCCCRRRSS